MDPKKVERLKITQEQMHEFLASSVKFWLSKSYDAMNGGFLVCFDENGDPTKQLDVMQPTDKMIVTQTRMIWGLSALINRGFAKEFGCEAECRDMAQHGIMFMLKNFWDQANDGFAWYTNQKGAVQDNGKLVYGQTFVIYAFAEYTLATGDVMGVSEAKKVMDALLKNCLDAAHGGFYENLTADWIPETERDNGGDLKSLDIHMHAMEAFTTLYQCTGLESHKRRLQEVIELILEYMIDYEYGCGRNQFDNSFRPKPARAIRRTWNYDRDPEHANLNPLDTTSYGHNIELSWLLNRAYAVLRQRPAIELTRKLADYTILNGWDPVYGGIFRDGMHDGRVVVTEKEWWQNFEALTGLMDAYQVTRDERYLDKFLDLWDFDYKYFYNKEVGESRQLLNADGTVIIGDMGNQWKCMYHTDRAMMECIPRINKVLHDVTL